MQMKYSVYFGTSRLPTREMSNKPANHTHWLSSCLTRGTRANSSRPLGQARRLQQSTWFSLFTFLALAAFVANPTLAEENTVTTHGLSVFGDLKYGPDFEHYNYVNPEAPKGGKLSLIGPSAAVTFNSLNPFILKGDKPDGMPLAYHELKGLTFDSLMARAFDEPDAIYGLVAHTVTRPADNSWIQFDLRPEAKFHDGSPLTAEDLVFTFDMIKEHGHPFLRFPIRDVVKAEAIDTHTVKYTFQGSETRDLPIRIAILPIASKAYYDKPENVFTETSLEAPLGSGPYQVKDYKGDTYITYGRVADYWAKDLPVNKGRFNFDEIRYEFYRDRDIGFEAFKSGAYDFREEFTSKTWATQYDFPAIQEGRVIKTTIDDERASGVQGFFINTRREKFKDHRVRRALDYAYDFEWANKNLFHGLYKRTYSYFQNSDLEADGAAGDAEQALLGAFSNQLPAGALSDAYRPPVNDGSGLNRTSLREAKKLLSKAGWQVENGQLVNDKGEPLKVEFLLYEPGFERVVAPFVQNLKPLGIDASIRLVDAAQFEERRKSFDYDILITRYTMVNTPGIELREYFSSRAAETEGSRNLAGVRSPVVDGLIEKVVKANDRAELLTATRSLDRVLRAENYWIPHWYKAAHNLAFWNKFSWPDVKPKYERGVVDLWWYDAEKAAKLEAN